MKSLLVLCAVVSASYASADVTGKWIGTLKPSADSKVPVNTKIQFTLELDKKGTFTYGVASTTNKGMPLSGTWKQNGSEITLTPSSSTKKTVPGANDQKLKVSADKKTMTMQVTVRVAAPANGQVKKNSPSKITHTIQFKRG